LWLLLLKEKIEVKIDSVKLDLHEEPLRVWEYVLDSKKVEIISPFCFLSEQSVVQ